MMETGQERPSILRPIVIVAGIIIILAAIKAAASILSLLFLAVFLAITFTPGFSWLRKKGVPGGLAILIMFAVIIGFALLLFGLAWFPISQFDDKLPGYQSNLSAQISAASNLLARYGIDVSSFDEQGFLDIGRVIRFFASVILAIGNTMFLLMVVVLTAIFMVVEAASYPERLRQGLGCNTVLSEQHQQLFIRQRY